MNSNFDDSGWSLEDLCDTMSDSDTMSLLSDEGYDECDAVINTIKMAVVEKVSLYNLVPLAVNVMHIVSDRSHWLDINLKVHTVVTVLLSYKELEEQHHICHSLVEKLYKLNFGKGRENMEFIKYGRRSWFEKIFCC